MNWIKGVLFGTGNPQLSRRLAVTLSLTLLSILVVATIAAAITAYLEARESQDETLLSIGRLLSSNQVNVQYDRKMFHDSDIDDGIRVWELGTDHRGAFDIKPSIELGFHSIPARHQIWRVLVVENGQSQSKYVAVQKLSVSTELAANSAWNTALPLLILFLLVPVLTWFVVKHSFKPLRNLTDRISTSDSLRLDASDEKNIPEEVTPFVAAIDSLLEKNEMYNQRQRRFLADASHELRTPITALSLEIENVQRAKEDSSRESRLSTVLQSTNRLQRLVNQLLDLARVQSENVVAAKPVSLNELVKTEIAAIYLLAEDKNIQLQVARNEPVTLLDINDQLKQLIVNALSNAIKYTPVSGLVNIDIYRRDSHAVFEVTDNGPGVAPEDLSRLKEPFFRPTEQATSIGAGLGLAICHEIASRLGGVLELSNVDPIGFRFTYSQPVSE